MTAGQGSAIRCKSETHHPVTLQRVDLDAGEEERLLPFPQAKHTINAATGKQMPIRAKGYCIHLARMCQHLQVHTALGVPDPHSRIQPCASEEASIGRKGQTY